MSGQAQAQTQEDAAPDTAPAVAASPATGRPPCPHIPCRDSPRHARHTGVVESRSRPACRYCKRSDRAPGLPLCEQCYKNPVIRRAYGPRGHIQKGSCKGCGTPAWLVGWGLCKKCRADPETAARFIPADWNGSHAKMPDQNVPVLPVLKEYPDHAAPVACPHGDWEESCPRCEALQRAGMTFAPDVGGGGAADDDLD